MSPVGKKTFIDGILNIVKGRDCIGSINTFKNMFLDGLLLMERGMVPEFQEKAYSQFNEDIKQIEVVENDESIRNKVQGKWGRPNALVLYD